jgi:hypothetical protein
VQNIFSQGTITHRSEKDESVPNTQSKILSSWLTLNEGPVKLIIVRDARNYGVMFDVDYRRTAVFQYLRRYLN